MANPAITSTTTRWADSTHISASMAFASGTGTITVYEGSTQQWTGSTTNNAVKSITFTGIDQSKTYKVNYVVVLSGYSASKWDTLIGETPVISTHPNGGVGLGIKASAGEFRTEYNAFFDGYAKFNDYILAMDGLWGPIDSSRYNPSDPLSTRELLSILPTLTYSNLGLSAGASDAEVSAFMKAWSKYIAALYPNLRGFSTALCQPDCELMVVWWTGGNDSGSLVNGIPKYSVGWAMPSYNDSRMFKFGTYNGTWFCYKFTGTSV